MAAPGNPRKVGNTEGVGPKAAGWIKATMKEVGKSTLKVGETVISKIILEYLGKGGGGMPPL